MSQQTQDDGGRSIDLCTENPLSPNFPRSILSVSREEFDRLPLTIKIGLTEQEGELPLDLQGHVFIIAPVGSVDSKSIPGTPVVLPCSDGWTPVFNGDGMIYRLDFEGGKANLTTRIVKTPCYYADLATSKSEKYQDFKFKNSGISRHSYSKLGIRNQVNTGFLIMKSSQQQINRLLVTWDAGRPYEIDPMSLEVVAPIGWNQQWSKLNPSATNGPFQAIMTSAHPGFDFYTNEMFTVNVCQSLSKLLTVKYDAEKIINFLKKNNPYITKTVIKLFQKSLNLLNGEDCVYLLRWDGQGIGNFDKWKLILEDGNTVKIQQSLHQLGITRDYLILADTAFKCSIEQNLPQPSNPREENALKLIRVLLDYPQLPYTNVYIIRRTDLNAAKSTTAKIKNVIRKIFFKQQPTIVVRKVELPLEMAHFCVDYENYNGKITLHSAHLCATDPAEFIRNIDISIYDDPEATNNLQKLSGIPCSPMDVSRLGCHVIDGESGSVEISELTSDLNHTWATAFCTYRDDTPTMQIEDIYWNSWGCWQDLMSKRIFDLYKNYENRKVSLEKVISIARKGLPANLCRLHIQRDNNADKHPKIQLNIEDGYHFPSGYLGSSAQFVPRADKTGSTEGYIICVVIHSDNYLSQEEPKSQEIEQWSDNSEIWIFDAEKLETGPLYRLSNSQLNFGFTLHTTWLPEIAPSPKRQDYNIRQDYDWLIDKQHEDIRQEIRNLFETEVYPNFEQNPSS